MSKETKESSGGQFANEAVPADQRMETRSIFGAMSGFIFMTTSLQAGANMGFAGDFPTVLKAIAIGAVFLAVIVVIMGSAAAQTGFTFGQLVNYSYGKHGSKIIAFLIAFSLLGWAAVDAGLMSGAITSVFPGLPYIPVGLISVVLFTSTVLLGMKAMSKLGTITIPVIGILGIISAVIGIRSLGNLSGLMAYAPAVESQLPFGSLVGLAIGSWIGCAASLLPDFMRFAKSTKVAVGLGLLFMLVLNPLMLIIGAIGAMSTGQGDMPFVLAAQGLAVPGLLIGVFGNWGPAQGNMYSTSLTWGNMFNIKYKKMVIIAAGVTLAMTAVDFFKYFGTFLIFLSNCVPPVIGVFIADFIFTYKNGYPDAEKLTGWDWRGLAAVIVGIGLAFSGLPGLTQLWSIGGAIVVRLVLNMIGKDSPAKIYND